MTITYIEKYEIPGHTFCGIQDCGKEPLFERKSGYQAWAGGCGIGHSKSVVGARQNIYDHAVQRLKEKRDELRKELRVVEAALEKLNPDEPDVFKLGQFGCEKFGWEKRKST